MRNRSRRHGVGAPVAAPETRYVSRVSISRPASQLLSQGPCQPPNPATSSSEAFGPQDPFL